MNRWCSASRSATSRRPGEVFTWCPIAISRWARFTSRSCRAVLRRRLRFWCACTSRCRWSTCSMPGRARMRGAAAMRLGIVASQFNAEVSHRLLERARAQAQSMGVEVAVTTVPGALEIPLALQWMAQSGRFDALVALGAVIRGETYHFEVVANESARGLMDVALDFGLPIANGILTTEDEPQAMARLDKGAEAVRVAVEMAKLKARLHEDG